MKGKGKDGEMHFWEESGFWGREGLRRGRRLRSGLGRDECLRYGC